MIHITHDNDGYPIRMYALVEVGKFKSMAEAARVAGISREAVKLAVEQGRETRGHYFRFADMPVECQPLRGPWRRRRIPVIWEGKAYPSIAAAAGCYGGAKYMRIQRALKRARAGVA